MSLDSNIAALPETAYAIEPSTGNTVIVKRGDTGFYDTGYGAQGVEAVKRLNERMGVTPAQAAAMEFGSMFGFHAPGANPDAYDEDGRFKRAAKR